MCIRDSSTFVGFSTFRNDVYVAGVATATTLHATTIGDSNSTLYGDGSNLTGLPPAGVSLGLAIALGG